MTIIKETFEFVSCGADSWVLDNGTQFADLRPGDTIIVDNCALEVISAQYTHGMMTVNAGSRQFVFEPNTDGRYLLYPAR